MPRAAIINFGIVESARDILKTKPIYQDALMALSILLPATIGATILSICLVAIIEPNLI